MWWLNELRAHTKAGLTSINVVVMSVGNKSDFAHTGHPTKLCSPLHILRDAGRAMRKAT